MTQINPTQQRDPCGKEHHVARPLGRQLERQIGPRQPRGDQPGAQRQGQRQRGEYRVDDANDADGEVETRRRPPRGRTGPRPARACRCRFRRRRPPGRRRRSSSPWRRRRQWRGSAPPRRAGRADRRRRRWRTIFRSDARHPAPKLCGFGAGFDAFDMAASSRGLRASTANRRAAPMSPHRARLSSPSTWAAYSTIGTMRP